MPVWHRHPQQLHYAEFSKKPPSFFPLSLWAGTSVLPFFFSCANIFPFPHPPLYSPLLPPHDVSLRTTLLYYNGCPIVNTCFSPSPDHTVVLLVGILFLSWLEKARSRPTNTPYQKRCCNSPQLFVYPPPPPHTENATCSVNNPQTFYKPEHTHTHTPPPP